MKISLEGFKGRFEQTEERIGQLEDKTIEIIEFEEQKENRLKKSEQNLKELYDTIKQSNIHIMRAPEGKENI